MAKQIKDNPLQETKRRMKYYIESGGLKTVLDANSPIKGCAKALYNILRKAKNTNDVPKLNQQFLVSERGFISDRVPFQVEVPFDMIIHADDVISEYNNY